jgi:predicted Zn finger-like uncharacterized protein
MIQHLSSPKETGELFLPECFIDIYRGDHQEVKIECPSCHLTGKVNEVELPAEGRNFQCPRCKESFFVGKPSLSASVEHLMNMCPVCQYSTFTDEMFAVCPNCGTTGTDYREMLLKKSKASHHGPSHEPSRPEEPPGELDQEQLLRDYELLNRSRRNPNFASPSSPEGAAAKKPALPLPIRITGWTMVAAGGLFLMYGLVGLKYYYGKDLQAALSIPFIEPRFSFRIFFQFGFFPWVRTIFSIGFVLAAIQFFRLRPWAPKAMEGMCRAGIGLVLVQEAAWIVNRYLNTSGTPSAIFYVDCLISFLLTAVLWSAPFLASIWLLTRDETIEKYGEPLPSSQ